MCGLLCGHVCELLRAKTDTFFSIFSSSKVPRVEVPAPPPFDHFFRSEEDCSKSISVLWEKTDEGGEDFLGDADEADDPPEDPKPPETVSPQTLSPPCPSLTE